MKVEPAHLEQVLTDPLPKRQTMRSVFSQGWNRSPNHPCKIRSKSQTTSNYRPQYCFKAEGTPAGKHIGNLVNLTGFNPSWRTHLTY